MPRQGVITTTLIFAAFHAVAANIDPTELMTSIEARPDSETAFGLKRLIDDHSAADKAPDQVLAESLTRIASVRHGTTELVVTTVSVSSPERYTLALWYEHGSRNRTLVAWDPAFPSTATVSEPGKVLAVVDATHLWLFAVGNSYSSDCQSDRRLMRVDWESHRLVEELRFEKDGQDDCRDAHQVVWDSRVSLTASKAAYALVEAPAGTDLRPLLTASRLRPTSAAARADAVFTRATAGFRCTTLTLSGSQRHDPGLPIAGLIQRCTRDGARRREQ